VLTPIIYTSPIIGGSTPKGSSGPQGRAPDAESRSAYGRVLEGLVADMVKRRSWVEKMSSLASAAALCVALFLVARARVTPISRAEPDLIGEGERISADLVLQPLTASAEPGVAAEIRVPSARPTLLLVFSSTCPSCYANLPAWRQVIEASRGVVRVIAVGMEPDRTSARDYAQRHLADAEPTAPSDPRAFAEALGVNVVPLTALIDSDGTVRSVKRGSLDSAALSSIIGVLGALTRSGD
jgi:hypothetical protein